VWYKEIKLCKCHLAEEMLQHIPSCRSIGKNRFFFNIKGNQYRLVIRANFYLQTVWIRFIGTHQDYDKINALEI
jgi:mRNA interferase HigB